MQRSDRNRHAFTLAELLVVIGIIAVLVAILIPAISHVRQRAHAADSANMISQLQAAIENYHQTYKGYPGPIPDDMVHNANLANSGSLGIGFTTPAPANYETSWNPTKITGAENLVLGLLGGLKYVPAGASFNILYDPTQVGLGPMTLNGVNPKRDQPMADQAGLSWRDKAGLKTGRFADGSGFADDTVIPEFVDKFPQAMPILYLRAKRGVSAISTGTNATNNSVITFGNNPPGGGLRVGTYDVAQIIAYTGAYDGDEAAPSAPDGNFPPAASTRSIGEGKKAPKYYNGPNVQAGIPAQNWFHGLRQDVNVNSKLTPQQAEAVAGSSYFYPLNAFAYFQDPSMPNGARQKEGYILISAGVDRIYGTNDDITSFGSVQQ